MGSETGENSLQFISTMCINTEGRNQTHTGITREEHTAGFGRMFIMCSREQKSWVMGGNRASCTAADLHCDTLYYI